MRGEVFEPVGGSDHQAGRERLIGIVSSLRGIRKGCIKRSRHSREREAQRSFALQSWSQLADAWVRPYRCLSAKSRYCSQSYMVTSCLPVRR